MSTPSRALSLCLIAALSLFAFGCPSSEEDTPDAGPEPDVQEDTVDEPDADDPDTGPDVDDGSCAVQADCADSEYCLDQECHAAPTCTELHQWEDCVDAFLEIDPDLARRAYCDGSFCRVSCLLDEECRAGEVCTDNGRCAPFTGELTGVHPGGDSPQPLRAGVGNALMTFPIGLSQGGYGSRMGFNAGRYVESLQPSAGAMHGLQVRGVAIDDGTRQLMFLRAPIIFPSMALHEAVARNLQAETGHDWRDSLVLSGTHTHSGPARFWQLPHPDEVLFPMGIAGIDEFSQHAFDWLVTSFTDAAMEALDDLSPAQMGWTVVESFDTDDVISSDRWGETPPFDDNRVLLIRIDDMDDNPRAVLVSYGTHATVHSGPYMTDDVMIGVERVMEQALGREYGVYAPVMYFNQNGGSMSPRGDRAGHRRAQVFESLGAHLVDRTFDALTDMETTTEWSFSGYTHRFPILYEYFGYEDHEFGRPGEDTINGSYLFGTLTCDIPGSSEHEVSDPNDIGCGGIHTMSFHRPVTILSKAQISAFQLNDLTLVTMPGELTMELGWQVQKRIHQTYDIDPFNSFTWGYANDHLLYLVPTNLRGERPPFPGHSLEAGMDIDDFPDFAFSYLQGGYEAQSSPWGFKLGDFLLDRVLEAVGTMVGEDIDFEFPVPFPDEFPRRDDPPFPMDATDADDVGTFTAQPPSQVERREYVEFSWIGGDPGAEMPQTPLVTLERENGGSFEPVILDSQVPYDNREFTMLTRKRRAGDDWEWVVYWEELKDFPLGTYRFRVNGHYLPEPDAEILPYEVSTDPFELVGSTAITVDEVQLSGSTLTFRLSYPPAPQLNTNGPNSDRGRASGSYRMHHRWVASGLPIPVEHDEVDDLTIAVFQQQGPALSIESTLVETNPETVEGRANVPVTRVTLELSHSPGSEVAVDVDVRDIFDNTGTFTTSITP